MTICVKSLNDLDHCYYTFPSKAKSTISPNAPLYTSLNINPDSLKKFSPCKKSNKLKMILLFLYYFITISAETVVEPDSFLTLSGQFVSTIFKEGRFSEIEENYIFLKSYAVLLITYY